ncbi:ubiquinol-cytochrome c reductase core subunit 2 [Sporothrix brasiliensis 5110]|uniref:Cytochrome b-c1 complex subunit 2, mitochondrial n=1 Tax=Sporothrix brasiliensis 5110 TaxID=1398154 RepID=A0A0C2IR20_9PEZI|nr:ubiquinol-cytochrome c reductase core subunit 2 [Sporothrix brasiliensis 5110]KIH91461.1 ubiquinol-cytochrome c reductase core subunit 2 [Sporothrix brasiliensis 5110]
MISRSAVSRAGQLALRRQSCAQAQSRGFAAAASSSGAFEPTEVSGVSVVSKDAQGPSTKLAIVAKAGTRYQPAPGLTAGLEGFSFKNTLKRSALRITRETELLGGELTSYHTREAVVLEANFLREHLPYFTELLAEVVAETKFTEHELAEEIEPVLHLKQAKYSADSLAAALDAAHAVAFHTGLGEALSPSTTTPLSSYLSHTGVSQFASSAYSRSNFALVADGATQVALSKWVDQFFKKSTGSGSALTSAASKYYGGQQRIESASGNAIVIAFPTNGLNAPDATVEVLTSLLGGESSVKWSPGFTLLSKASAGVHGANAVARNLSYSDAGLLTVQVTGQSAGAVRAAADVAVKALKSVASGSVSKEDVAKAIAKARFDALTAQEPASAAITAAGTAVLHGLKTFQPADASKAYAGVTAEKLTTLAKKLVSGKASFAAVGDLHVLPFAEDVGLTV